MTQTQRYIKLLSNCLTALNSLPNTRVNTGEFKNSYEIAAALGDILREPAQPDHGKPVTTLDNDQRVFMITGDERKQIFCNLHDLPDMIAEFDSRENMIIYHFEDFKQKRASKKLINDMLKADGSKFRYH